MQQGKKLAAIRYGKSFQHLLRQRMAALPQSKQKGTPPFQSVAEIPIQEILLSKLKKIKTFVLRCKFKKKKKKREVVLSFILFEQRV